MVDRIEDKLEYHNILNNNENLKCSKKVRNKNKYKSSLKKEKEKTDDKSILSNSDSEEMVTKEKLYTKYEISNLLKLAKETNDMKTLIDLTHHELAEVRLKSIQRLCPCRVLDNIYQFWDRIFEMKTDKSSAVRMQVLHNMCDGSPAEYENKVREALEVFNCDEDKEIRRKAHKVLGSYLRTGKYNIL